MPREKRTLFELPLPSGVNVVFADSGTLAEKLGGADALCVGVSLGSTSLNDRDCMCADVLWVAPGGDCFKVQVSPANLLAVDADTLFF